MIYIWSSQIGAFTMEDVPFALPATPRQIAYARSLALRNQTLLPATARIKRRAVPDECFRDRGLMSKWIDGNR